MSAAGDPVASLTAAWIADDASRVRALLEQHPEMTAMLHQPLPGAAFGSLAIHEAVSRRNREMIDVLLYAGADINARTEWWAGGFGVLDGNGELAPFLIERGAQVDVHAAARHGMIERLKELVDANPDLVHARGGDGQTPLHVAATVEIARYLLDHGADIDARDVDHESTPAQYMVREHQEIVRFLIERGCRTDILMAAALGDMDLVKRHIEQNPASIRTTVSEEFFPKVDPRAGGTIYIWTLGEARTPHTVAREFGHEDIVRVLMEHSPAVVKLTEACELGDENLLEKLLAAHPGVIRNLTDSDRRRIADAARNNYPKVVRLMLGAGWPVDVRGKERGTPLHWAAWHGNVEMVREILRYNPPLDARDNEWDSSPIGWAIYASKHGWHPKAGDYKGTVEALIEAGAAVPELTDDTESSEAVRHVLERHNGHSTT